MVESASSPRTGSYAYLEASAGVPVSNHPPETIYRTTSRFVLCPGHDSVNIASIMPQVFQTPLHR